MNYEEWEREVPEEIKTDSLWKMQAYRLALFVGDLGWYDVSKLMQDKRTFSLSDQLYRALGSISANITEGYAKSTGKDRARFFEYSLGSARESRDWYFKGRHILDKEVTSHRLNLITQIIKLLTKTVPDQRTRTLREERAKYQTDDLNSLLSHVPMPN